MSVLEIYLEVLTNFFETLYRPLKQYQLFKLKNAKNEKQLDKIEKARKNNLGTH